MQIHRPQLTTAKDNSYMDSRKTWIREVLSEERFPGFGIVQIKCHSVRSVKLLHICPYLKYVIIDIIMDNYNYNYNYGHQHLHLDVDTLVEFLYRMQTTTHRTTFCRNFQTFNNVTNAA